MRDTYLDYPTFLGKVRQYECQVQKLDLVYHQSDHRCWSAVINPGKENIIVTYGINKYGPGTRFFDVVTSDRVHTDVYQEDVYPMLETLLGKGIVTTYFESNEQ